ncbi:hypothetical protein EV424DRAFT_1546373 [Suillus variegatus]|nr:hypothetical protein EV424DRAFT_1546373 [Suillus variegatus]
MLASGDYKIQNFLHTDRFIHMKADGTVVGYEEADIVQLHVTDAALGLATLFDKLRNQYIVIDNEARSSCVDMQEISNGVKMIDRSRRRQRRIPGAPVLHRERRKIYVGMIIVASNENSFAHFICRIHIMNVNEVWLLNKGKDWTPIVTAPAPPPGVQDYERKYWLFAEVC